MSRSICTSARRELLLSTRSMACAYVSAAEISPRSRLFSCVTAPSCSVELEREESVEPNSFGLGIEVIASPLLRYSGKGEGNARAILDLLRECSVDRAYWCPCTSK